MTRRLFVAVDLPDTARRAVSACVAQLRERLRAEGRDDDFRWVSSENLHITLRFIGAVPASDAGRVVACMNMPFEAERGTVWLGPAAAFPPRGRARLLHMAADDPHGVLGALRARVGERLSPVCRWAPDTRPYTPHVTIARARERRGQSDRARAINLTDLTRPTHRSIEVPVEEAVLFESRTLPSGPEYTIVGRTQLRST